MQLSKVKLIACIFFKNQKGVLIWGIWVCHDHGDKICAVCIPSYGWDYFYLLHQDMELHSNPCFNYKMD